MRERLSHPTTHQITFFIYPLAKCTNYANHMPPLRRDSPYYSLSFSGPRCFVRVCSFVRPSYLWASNGNRKSNWSSTCCQPLKEIHSTTRVINRRRRNRTFPNFPFPHSKHLLKCPNTGSVTFSAAFLPNLSAESILFSTFFNEFGLSLYFMDDITLEGLVDTPLVTSNHLRCALEAMASAHAHVRTVVCQRRLPDGPLPDAHINLLMAQLAALDSNNFPSHVGAGEREGRVFSSLVAARHYGMSHGVGRSGELDSHQPKAAGMSLLYPLCNALALDACRAAGFAASKRVFEAALVAPLATGMALSLVLRSLANDETDRRRKAHAAALAAYAKAQPEETRDATNDSANSVAAASTTPPAPPVMPRYVVWCRIDQKTCLKCIAGAGLEPIVVNLRPAPPPKEKGGRRGKNAGENTNEVAGGASLDAADSTPTSSSTSSYFMQSHVDDIRAAIDSVGAEAVAAVLSTTSCFAPRLPDNVLAIGRLCAALNVPHVINNAYGLQSRAINTAINSAAEAAAPKKTNAQPSRPEDRKGEGATADEDEKGAEGAANGEDGANNKKRRGAANNAAPPARIDAVVQSTDKNFMVPVGGAIIVGPAAVVRSASQLYPGRASAAPIVDLFITLLAMGKARFLALSHTDRYALLHNSFMPAVSAFAAARGESVVFDERNDISFGMTLKHAWRGGRPNDGGEGCAEDSTADVTAAMVNAAITIGSRLYHLGVTGPKVVYPNASENVSALAPSASRAVSGIKFESYGMHGSDEGATANARRAASAAAVDAALPSAVPPMIIFACAVGMTEDDVRGFMRRLEEVYPLGKPAAKRK